MTRFIKDLVVVVLALLTLASAAWGQAPPPAGLVPPDLRPGWTAVPNVKGVEFAPNSPVDLFRHGGRYYYYQRNVWYQGKSVAGPWQQVAAPPPVFQQIDAAYFKTPPGWAKGKKTGWKGAPMPPGQMKKSGGANLPPGQMKKMYGE